jgi:hypothetical protein
LTTRGRISDDGARRAGPGVIALRCLCAAALGLMFLAAFSSARGQQPARTAQWVTVRFLSPKSGKPIRKMSVTVTQWRDVPPPPSEGSDMPYFLGDKNAQTNRNGEVRFRLNDPPPKFVDVHSFQLWYSGDFIPISKILESGVVLDYSGAKPPRGYWVNKRGQPIMKSGTLLGHGSKGKRVSKLKIKAKPGKIIYIEKKITLWQRMLQEMP